VETLIKELREKMKALGIPTLTITVDGTASRKRGGRAGRSTSPASIRNLIPKILKSGGPQELETIYDAVSEARLRLGERPPRSRESIRGVLSMMERKEGIVKRLKGEDAIRYMNKDSAMRNRACRGVIFAWSGEE
jgi:hypothetical protein